MNTPLHDYIRPGIVHFMAFPECAKGEGPVLETVEQIICDPFFEAIEITHIASDDVRRRVRERCDQARVELLFGAQPMLLGGGLDLNHPDKAERDKAIAKIQKAIDEAAGIGVRSVALLSGKAVAPFDQARARLIESLKRICAYGRECGVDILLETFDRVPFGKHCLIGPTEEAVEVSAAIREEFPAFGLLLDLSHLPLIGESAIDAIAVAGEHLVHVHIGNCAMDDPNHPAYGDNHPRFGASGTRNDVPELTEYLRVLFDTGYLSPAERKIVSFEVKPMPGEDALAVIAGNKRTLVEAWRRV